MNRQQRRAAERLNGKASSSRVRPVSVPDLAVTAPPRLLDTGIPSRGVRASAPRGSDAAEEETRSPRARDGGNSRPKLSICLITYNRAAYLRKTLTGLFAAAQFPFDYELLVCDNASIDNTPEVVAEMAREHPQLRYVRQKRNVGGDANLMAAYRMAKGEYVVYLADDDQLIPEAVAQVLHYMDGHPDVGVCHCPWELWDDVAGQSLGLFYQVGESRQFSRGNSLEMCDLILQNHIFPEISIYRTEVVRRMIYLPRSAYWAFVHLISVLDHAKVAFLPFPYYRSITRHWEGETREQAGHGQAMYDWDSYRGGVELMIHRAFLTQGAQGVPPEHVPKVADAVQKFVHMRMKVALRLLLGKQDYIAAHAVMVRLLVAGALLPQEAREIQPSITARAALQAFIQAFDATTTLDRVGFYQVSNPPALKVLLQDLRPGLTVVDLDPGAADEREKDRMLVLTRSAQTRMALIDAGYHPGFVMIESDLAWMFAS